MLNKKHLSPIILLAILSFSVACEQKAAQSVIVNITPDGKVIKPGGGETTQPKGEVSPEPQPTSETTQPKGEPSPEPSPSASADSESKVIEEIKAIIEENANAINSQNLSVLLATLHPLSPLKATFEQLGSQIFVGGTRQQILDVTNILHNDKTATAQVSRKVSDNFGVVLEKTSFSLEISNNKWLIMSVAINSQEQAF